MIDHKLAKKLKDAGFPQDEVNYFDDKRGDIYIPTLSELIEACGHIELDNISGDNIWRASQECGLPKYGKSPEEAAAKLWLELNKKK